MIGSRQVPLPDVQEPSMYIETCGYSVAIDSSGCVRRAFRPVTVGKGDSERCAQLLRSVSADWHGLGNGNP